ncbi:hypothetical protein HETIRDRAFT_446559 [Heterobasidion irregulare TC 32-1]|uniref:Uncharacterized protein n=1 Tax=Heterobasidion irregulare (strain TC 32-1) TaxID=747525 RepID=W4JUX6_HETIT|nr:uncharacterized protein HETIRDRAFT_446559 [Heterobasidion irregulare TC 32-1]ETW76696.1 hypothetical protein HETIRDRAFT_446559 [Heterobasidion irregulare TC 32-1]
MRDPQLPATMPSSSLLGPDTFSPVDVAVNDRNDLETAISADDPTGVNDVSDPGVSNDDEGGYAKKPAKAFLPRGPPKPPVRGPGPAPKPLKPAPAPAPATQQPKPAPPPQLKRT